MRRTLFILLTITGLWLLAITSTVHAEDVPTDTPVPTETPLPTITPTPLYDQPVALQSGNQMVVERRITYGEIGITLALLAILAVLLIYVFVRIPTLWNK